MGNGLCTSSSAASFSHSGQDSARPGSAGAGAARGGSGGVGAAAGGAAARPRSARPSQGAADSTRNSGPGNASQAGPQLGQRPVGGAYCTADSFNTASRTDLRMVSPEQRKAAEDLKTEGNALFSKSKFAAAIEKYTEAITLYPSWPVLYVNRAMCHKKKDDWPRVLEDSQKALALDSDSMKGHYLLGLAQLKLDNHKASVSHLKRALDAARDHNDAIKDEIWHELARACYAQWQSEAMARRQQLDQLKQQLRGMMQLGADAPLPPEWKSLFDSAAARDSASEAPSMFTCPLTMEIFRDPVVTPSGRTYEKAALLEHLTKVGGFYPITRQAMTSKEVIPNLSMRAAIENYLEEHPWSWGEAH